MPFANVFRTQLDDLPDTEIISARAELNRRYDNYAHRFGPLSSRENIRAFSGDPDQPLLLSLENYDSETKTATKTAIFERRTLQRIQDRSSTLRPQPKRLPYRSTRQAESTGPRCRS